MLIKDHYIIKQDFMHMRGHYDRCGKQCTEVTETYRRFIVDKSPLEIIAESIMAIGYNLKGAIETSRLLLGDVHMCPILVNPINRIVVFPTKAHKHEDTIWFNPFHIKRTTSFYRKTHVLFSNGSSLDVPLRLSSFNSKIQNAAQLEDLTASTSKEPIVFLLKPKKKHKTKIKK